MTDQKILVSIIVITKNEEENLERLLNSLGDIPKDFEVIVSDNKSTDKTLEVAKKYGCVINRNGGLPSEGRNNGVKLARGEYLYFSDADYTYPKNFINKLRNIVSKNDVEIGCLALRIKIEKPIHYLDNFFSFITNICFFLIQKKIARGYGGTTFCKRGVFDAVDGYKTSLKVGEDYDFIKRAAKNRKFKFLLSPSPYMSARRFDAEGRIKTVLKYWGWQLHWIFSKDRQDIPTFGYEFDEYRSKDTK